MAWNAQEEMKKRREKAKSEGKGNWNANDEMKKRREAAQTKKNNTGRDFLYGSANGKSKSNDNNTGRSFLYGDVNGKPKKSNSNDYSAADAYKDAKTAAKVGANIAKGMAKNAGVDWKGGMEKLKNMGKSKPTGSSQSKQTVVKPASSSDIMSRNEFNRRMKYEEEFSKKYKKGK